MNGERFDFNDNVSIAVPKNNSQMLYKTSYDGAHKRILDLVKEYKTIYKASYAR